MKRALLSLLVLLGAFSSSANAHEMRPAYLELRQTSSSTYDLLWKVPGRGENMRLGIYVRLPEGCIDTTEPRASMLSNTYFEQRSVSCHRGLTGGTIRIEGLDATMTDVLVRIEHLDGTTQTARLLPASPALVVEAAPHRLEVARTYTVLGIEHILGGIDHLLFVLALLIITKGGWRLVKTVTAFTASHSLTLTAASLGWVHVPQRPVEAVIALSIVLVAAEIIRMDRGEPTLTSRYPWLVALIFGLVHGLGFAGGLSEAGLPVNHIPTALLFFSIGVETGHFLFIGAVLLLIALVRRVRISIPQWAELVPPYAIGTCAAFWLVQRTSLFLL
ncbi:MAG: HupE/UreJ family protein [Burkholderiaceae bacterium]|nr:HupE/UreJ family protein [Burkholderiaceae bacterium]